jgi:CysZ protein
MRDLGVGFQYLVQGQKWVARHGKQYGFGLIPGLITLVLYLAALTALAVWGPDFVAWCTPFADDWSSPWSGLFRGLLTAVLFALALLLSVVTFTAMTLLIGQPFYENLSEKVDRDVSPDGTAPESGLPFWRELWISARDSLRIVARAALWGVLLFGLGFVPFVGQTVVPVIGFFVTGFFLTEELTGVALQRRRIELRDRLRLLRSRRMLVWGFGTPLGLAFLVPFVAVFLMPGAVAGATLMVRDLLGEETTGGDDRDDHDDHDGRSGGGPGGGHAPRPRPADPWTKPQVR